VTELCRATSSGARSAGIRDPALSAAPPGARTKLLRRPALRHDVIGDLDDVAGSPVGSTVVVPAIWAWALRAVRRRAAGLAASVFFVDCEMKPEPNSRSDRISVPLGIADGAGTAAEYVRRSARSLASANNE
jgi:hypothetical protein